jgi:hypothetical protein
MGIAIHLPSKNDTQEAFITYEGASRCARTANRCFLKPVILGKKWIQNSGD